MECLICGGKKPKLIQSSRIQSFRDASEQRGDSLSEKLPEGELHLTCHRSCISTYYSKHHIEHCLRKRKVETCDAPPSPKKLRGKCAFNFLQDCLFCGTGCTVSRPLKNPSSMANVPQLGLFDSTNGLVQVVADNFDTEILPKMGRNQHMVWQ